LGVTEARRGTGYTEERLGSFQTGLFELGSIGRCTSFHARRLHVGSGMAGPGHAGIPCTAAKKQKAKGRSSPGVVRKQPRTRGSFINNLPPKTGGGCVRLCVSVCCCVYGESRSKRLTHRRQETRDRCQNCTAQASHTAEGVDRKYARYSSTHPRSSGRVFLSLSFSHALHMKFPALASMVLTDTG